MARHPNSAGRGRSHSHRAKAGPSPADRAETLRLRRARKKRAADLANRAQRRQSNTDAEVVVAAVGLLWVD